MTNSFLQIAVKNFMSYKALADKTFLQISEEDYHFKYNDDFNSLAVIIKHMHGNMLSRFSDFLNSDGEKTWRKRDEEFLEPVIPSADLLKIWEEGWDCLFTTLYSLQEDDLFKTVMIRGEAHTVTEAIIRQLTHYAYHVGQIVTIGKMKAKEWKSLSIPKDASEEFNRSMYSK